MFGLSCLVGPGGARQARVGPDSYYLQSHKMRARPYPVLLHVLVSGLGHDHDTHDSTVWLGLVAAVAMVKITVITIVTVTNRDVFPPSPLRWVSSCSRRW